MQFCHVDAYMMVDLFKRFIPRSIDYDLFGFINLFLQLVVLVSFINNPYIEEFSSYIKLISSSWIEFLFLGFYFLESLMPMV